MSDYQSAYEECHRRVVEHVKRIYPEEAHVELATRLIDALCLGAVCTVPEARKNHWSQQDLVLITYGNSVRIPDEKPLTTLLHFLENRMENVVTGVHVLPFFPFSSDDGFSVIDYTIVNPSLGDWDDIKAIAAKFDLMSDLVINHCSSRSAWFEQFQRNERPGKDYFITVGKDTDTSLVTRPRTHPLLRLVQTNDGEKHVWCTFSHDQIDLNFANPDVLIEMIKVIALYLENGVRIFRLDAVAFLWKKLGTSCINLPQTHEVVRLLRTLVEFYSPATMLITETNIPNRENLSYLGNANEAHSIYNFSLPPLLLHTMVTGNCEHLKSWLMSMPPAQLGTAYFNFIASHDGIGLRPVEGLLSDDEIGRLVSVMEAFGGAVSWRTLSDGSQRPYEINIALADAMRGTADGEDGYLVARFLSVHAIMLALEGIPGIYIHSFLGTRNDLKKLEISGNNRSINRHCWDYDELQQVLNHEDSLNGRIFEGMKVLCGIRQAQPAFNPNATQFTLHLGNKVFAFWRQSLRRDQSIFCLNNITHEPQTILLNELNLVDDQDWRDLLSDAHFADTHGEITLAPYQTVWLANFDGKDFTNPRCVGIDNPFVSEPSVNPNERRRSPRFK